MKWLNNSPLSQSSSCCSSLREPKLSVSTILFQRWSTHTVNYKYIIFGKILSRVNPLSLSWHYEDDWEMYFVQWCEQRSISIICRTSQCLLWQGILQFQQQWPQKQFPHISCYRESKENSSLTKYFNPANQLSQCF